MDPNPVFQILESGVHESSDKSEEDSMNTRVHDELPCFLKPRILLRASAFETRRLIKIGEKRLTVLTFLTHQALLVAIWRRGRFCSMQPPEAERDRLDQGTCVHNISPANWRLFERTCLMATPSVLDAGSHRIYRARPVRKRLPLSPHLVPPHESEVTDQPTCSSVEVHPSRSTINLP